MVLRNTYADINSSTCIASMIVLAPAFNYSEQSDDITWNNVSMFIWATVEVNVAVAAGNFLPNLGAWVANPSILSNLLIDWLQVHFL